MKSLYYVANIVRVYRKAIDEYYKDPENFKYDPQWLEEIEKASHREFSTGFYYDKPSDKDQHYGSSAYTREYDFLGIVQSYDAETKLATIEQRNKMSVGDKIEIMGPDYVQIDQAIGYMENERGYEIQDAPHAQQIIKMRMEAPVEPYYILRKERMVD